MASFTMDAQTFVTPASGAQSPVDHAITAASGTTVRANWTATGLVNFTGNFVRQDTSATFGPQGFVNSSSGSWIWTQSGAPYDDATPIGIELTGVTNNGHNITVTISVDNGHSYSGRWRRRTGVWVWTTRYRRRSGAWVFTPRYRRRAGAWVLVHR